MLRYTIDVDRKFGGYQAGDLICYINPFFGIPLKLEIAIRIDGSIVFRSWTWTQGNGYLHTHEKPVGKETLIDADTDFKDWSINELKERVNLVCRFDKLCNDIRDTFLWYLENSEIKEIEVVRTEKQTVVVVNNA